MIITSREALDDTTVPSVSVAKPGEWTERVSNRPFGRRNYTAALLLADIAAAALVSICVIPPTTLLSDPHWPLVNTPMNPASLRSPLGICILVAMGALVYLACQSHYSQRTPFWAELKHVVVASILALLCGSLLTFELQGSGSRVMHFEAWLLFPAVAIGLRKLLRQGLGAAGLWQIRTVVVGDMAATRETLSALTSEPALGYAVVAVVSPGHVSEGRVSDRWRRLLEHYQAALVVLVCDANNAPDRMVVNALIRERVVFAVIPQIDGLPVHGFEQTRFFSHDTVMFTYRNNLAQPLARILKIVFDWLVASIGILALAPLILLIVALVKRDGGPAFFGHLRVGANGRPFRCLKFRSMVIDSDGVLRRLLASDPAIAKEWAETQKLKHDPRITAIGRLLRATSLDELPQLFNVLMLQMSLVGPRPIVQAEVARYGEEIAYYYETRPGLTGLWQVSGRAGTSYDYRVHLDTWYVKNWTIWHDVAILAKTVPAVLTRRGAF